jgi:hypothetical protein
LLGEVRRKAIFFRSELSHESFDLRLDEIPFLAANSQAVQKIFLHLPGLVLILAQLLHQGVDLLGIVACCLQLSFNLIDLGINMSLLLLEILNGPGAISHDRDQRHHQRPYRPLEFPAGTMDCRAQHFPHNEDGLAADSGSSRLSCLLNSLGQQRLLLFIKWPVCGGVYDRHFCHRGTGLDRRNLSS